MKRLAITVLCLSTFAVASPKAPIVRAPKAVVHASWRVLSWPFRAPKPEKKADGSGPIQTCRPGTNCDPVV